MPEGPGCHAVARLVRLLFTLVFAVLSVGVVGCLPPKGPAALPSDYAEALHGTTKKIIDQGVLDKWASNAQANLQNPGLESYLTSTWIAGVRIAGMNGRFDVNAGGDGTQLPPGVREELIKQLSQPISDQQRNAILEILGWNRKQETASGGGGTDGG